jgi:hypothetical protein
MYRVGGLERFFTPNRHFSSGFFTLFSELEFEEIEQAAD